MLATFVESLVYQFEMMNAQFDLIEEQITSNEMQLGALTSRMERMDTRIS